jgi:hypothetical protein
MILFLERSILCAVVALTAHATHAATSATQAQGSKAPKQAASKPDPLAQRLCDAIHTLPVKRKSECCPGEGSSNLAPLCAQELSASIRRGAVRVDAAGIDRCTQETSSELEGCGWVNPTLPPLPHGCDGLVQGTLPAGAKCESSVECADGLHCKSVTPLAPGICSAPSAARTSCEVPADNLVTLLRTRTDPRHPECQGRCVRGECLPFVEAGGACAASATCASGLNCIAGHCEKNPLPKAGEPCPGKTACDTGAYCSPEGRCVALKNAGESCSQPFECRGLACAKAPGEKSGKCGEPCGSAVRSGRASH